MKAKEKDYEVSVVYRGQCNFIVRATSPKQAQDKALKMFKGGIEPVALGNEWEEPERVGTPELVGKNVAAQLVRDRIARRTARRRAQIIKQAVEGLTEYYPQLENKSLVQQINEQVTVPDTGNDQADYENVRDQVERLLQD